ncbi:unnamed protein product [Cylicocyclus nassatus]|uniref:Uncharacterized protein n=1 Tax=Cylicocyclus nassatus TaxID=53992 RepID=A0AA36GTQ5_CYLNA|nr:unnamed protein product [Cylicocyclus nassatus]
MERIRRLKTFLLSIEPWNAAETTARLAVASGVNLYLSQCIFDPRIIQVLDEAFKASSLSNSAAFRTDIVRMTKMHKLWPPHMDFRIAAVFTTALYILLNYFLQPIHILEALNRFRKSSDNTADDSNSSSNLQNASSSNISLRFLSSAVTATLLFILLLPMQRIAEMHIFVIVLNFLHILLISVLTTLIMFIWSERGKNKIKSE